MKTWPLQEAKAKFSALVDESIASGAQMVTRHGEPAVVIIPIKEYERMSSKKESLASFFSGAPRVELNIERSRDEGRIVDL
jgi:antitoxin Phd